MGEQKEASPFILKAREAQESVKIAAEQIRELLKWVPLLQARIERARSASARAKVEAELEELRALAACAEACVVLRHDLVPFRRELRELKKAVGELEARVAAKGVSAVA
jgi:hypothetical protein